MKPQHLLLSAVLLCTAGVAAADTMKNPVSVHVLNLQTGIPTAGVKVELDQKAGDNWTKLAEATTDAQGRIPALYPKDKMAQSGIYRVVFKTGDYYKSVNQQTFFPEIPVIFNLEKTDQHYHIPLLLSQYGYSTYRGN